MPDSTQLWLVSFFCSACIITNLLTVKYIAPWGYKVTAALFTYALTFVFTDLLSELYGHCQTMYAIWGGLLTNSIVFGIVFLGNYLTPHALAPVTDSFFSESFSFVEVTIVASMMTYVVAQCIDIYIFASLRKKTKGHLLWLRNNVGTLISQSVDTMLFAFLAWQLWRIFPHKAPPLTWDTWWQISLRELYGKMVIALCDTPLVYGLLWLKRKYLSKAIR